MEELVMLMAFWQLWQTVQTCKIITNGITFHIGDSVWSVVFCGIHYNSAALYSLLKCPLGFYIIPSLQEMAQ